MNIENLTPSQLRKAADLQEQIEQLQSEFASLVGGKNAGPVEAPQPAKVGKRTMSASARAKIAAAQRARWAKQKGTAKAVLKAEPKSAKRKMSAAGRAAIVAAQKARWAKIKAAKAKK